jgi:hypothetical protein
MNVLWDYEKEDETYMVVMMILSGCNRIHFSCTVYVYKRFKFQERFKEDRLGQSIKLFIILKSFSQILYQWDSSEGAKVFVDCTIYTSYCTYPEA